MQTLSSDEEISGLNKGYWRNTFILTIIAIVVLSVSAALISNYYRISQFKTESVYLIQKYGSRELNFDLNLLADSPEKSRDVVHKIPMLMDIYKLLELKIWTTDMRTVYSMTERETVGKYYPENTELKESIDEDKVILALDTGNKFENRGLNKHGLMLEMYVPIHQNGKVSGVLEVYRSAPGLNLFGKINLLVAAVVLFMGILFNFMISTKFRYAIKTILGYQKTLIDANKSIASSYHHSVVSLAKALEMRDLETEGHCERVVNMSIYIGRKMGLDDLTMGRLAIGAYLHDVGKIGIPDSILLKPGRLTPEERVIIETHVMKGYEIIKNVPFLENAEEVVKYHHEKFNGKGYPHGLKGDEIPVAARIFALVDVFDALISRRPYKEPMPLDKILEIIRTDRGEHFCPEVCDIILSMSEEELLSINSDIQAGHISSQVNGAVISLLEHDFSKESSS